MTLVVILNVVLAVLIVAAIVGLLLVAILTGDREPREPETAAGVVDPPVPHGHRSAGRRVPGVASRRRGVVTGRR